MVDNHGGKRESSVGVHHAESGENVWSHSNQQAENKHEQAFFLEFSYVSDENEAKQRQ